MHTLQLTTADGTCPAHVFTPAGEGPWPGVLFFMDGVGIRPALFEMGERLAAAGYYVLLPDLYYRGGPYEPVNAKELFADPERRAMLSKRVAALATTTLIMRDVPAFLDHLAAHAKPGKVGATGYCMGGRLAVCAAETYPDRFAAVAAYHPGGLATDAPDSPHLLVQNITARVYIGAASDDASFTDEQKQRFAQALTAAKVEHVMETYPAKHGWVPSDTPTHDPAQTERHWTTLLDLLR